MQKFITVCARMCVFEGVGFRGLVEFWKCAFGADCMGILVDFSF